MDEDKKQRNTELLKDTALAGGSLAALKTSKNMILGKKRMYHGTSLDNWNKIKDQGLLANRGGLGGASAVYKTQEKSNNIPLGDAFIKSSEGHVHFTPRKIIANQYANVASNNLDYANGTGKDFIDGSLRVKKGGKKIKMDILYDNYKKARPDMGIESPNHTTKFGEFMMKHMHGSKTKVDVSPEEIIGSSATLKDRAKMTAKALPSYIKNNPARFAGGLALAGAGAYGINSLVKKKKKEIEKKAMEE